MLEQVRYGRKWMTHKLEGIIADNTKLICEDDHILFSEREGDCHRNLFLLKVMFGQLYMKTVVFV
jgi:hypothetical protein